MLSEITNINYANETIRDMVGWLTLYQLYAKCIPFCFPFINYVNVLQHTVHHIWVVYFLSWYPNLTPEIIFIDIFFKSNLWRCSSTGNGEKIFHIHIQSCLGDSHRPHPIEVKTGIVQSDRYTYNVWRQCEWNLRVTKTN